MPVLPITTAAQLVQTSYEPARQPDFARRIKHALKSNDVEAYFLHSGTLVIPGSNSLSDYLKFNTRVFRVGGTRYKVKNLSTEKAKGILWHQGFLAHTKEIQDWLKLRKLRPVYIVGHSLGAASTQILCRLLDVPGIGFAAPRTRKHAGHAAQADTCLNVNRDDDFVCNLPRSFKHLGRVHLCRTGSGGLGLEHSMRHYRQAVDDQQSKGLLPVNWPA
jgi:hypothetical protein